MTGLSSATGGMPFPNFWEAVRHRILLVVGIVCVFMLFAVLAIRITQPAYQASATLYVDVRGQDTLLRQSDGLLSAQFVQQATSRKVLDMAIRDLKLQGTKPETLAKKVHASLSKAAPEIVVTAEAPTAAGASDLATGVANALIAVHRDDVAQLTVQTRDYLSAELARLDKEIQQVGNPAPGSAAMARLTLLQNQYSTTYGHLEDVNLAQAQLTDALTLEQAAQPPSSPARPDPLRYLIVALLGGVVTAVFAVLLAERLDDRLTDAEELAHATGTPVALDLSRPGDEGPSEPAYALLRANLLTRYPQASVVMVVPIAADDYALPVAMQLRRAQEQAAGNNAKQPSGSGEAYASASGREKRARRNAPATDHDDNVQLFRGAIPPAPDELSSEPSIGFIDESGNASRSDERMANHLHPFEAAEDLLILAVNSPRTGPEAFTTASRADLAVLVATARQTRSKEARFVAQALRDLGVDIAASVLIRNLGQTAAKPAA